MKQIQDQEFLNFCLFAVYTGLRSGEIIRLTWQDIDNPQDFIRISPKQKNRLESRVPINKHVRKILNQQQIKHTDRIFRFNGVTWISQKFKKAAIKANLHDIRFHDLRHTFASHLAMSGENLKVIQELMRHESISSTLVYAKVSPEHLKKASEKIDYKIKTQVKKPYRNRTVSSD